MTGRSIRFVYADPPGFSGQRNAARIVWEGMRARRWQCLLLPLPAVDRTTDRRRGLPSMLGYAVRLVHSWLRALRVGLSRPTDLTFLACSQTLGGLVRDGVAFLFATARCPRRSVISLNGNSFARWTPADPRARLLRFLVRRAAYVTVVGDGQRRNLERLGIPAAKIRVVTNTADTPLISADDLRAKHGESAGPVSILYLSSLITSKGYPLLLEAMRILGQARGAAVEVTLCGTIVVTNDERFASEEAARTWIETMLDSLNRTSRVRARWIEGAVGEAKVALLTRSHVFVLPTHYPVEAQPLALLEAMASGCAIVTTDIAEIPTLLPAESDAAVILHEPSPEVLAAALERLAADPARRRSLALAARERFERRFAAQPHLDAWESLCVGVCESP